MLYHDRLHPFRQTGGPSRTTVIGVDMIHLVTLLFVYSDVTQDKMAAFIYNKGCALYLTQQISERPNDLETTRKKASIEALGPIQGVHLLEPPPLHSGSLRYPDKN
jgi:hypothetical protein